MMLWSTATIKLGRVDEQVVKAVMAVNRAATTAFYLVFYVDVSLFLSLLFWLVYLLTSYIVQFVDCVKMLQE